MNTTFEQYKNLFDQAPCGIGLFSAVDGQRAFYLNKTYYDLIGYSKEEYETISDDPITALVYQDDVLRVQKLFDQSTSEPLEAEYRIINKKGELVWIKLNVSTMEADGEAFAFASFVDVSKEKKLNDQLSLIAGNIEYSISILMLDADGRLYLEYWNKLDELNKESGNYKDEIKRTHLADTSSLELKLNNEGAAYLRMSKKIITYVDFQTLLGRIVKFIIIKMKIKICRPEIMHIGLTILYDLHKFFRTYIISPVI